MKNILIIILLITISCSNKKDKKKNEFDTKKEIIDSVKTSLTLGERIDGPANIRDTINGKLLFELSDLTLVETTQIKNNWLEVGVFIKPTQEQADKFYILPNKKIYSGENQIIGITKDTVEFLMGGEDYALINGYSHKKNIKENSIPENGLMDLIKRNKFKLSEYSDYMKNFKYEISGLGGLNNVEQYFIYQSMLIDISPRDRITLIFREKILIGFVHSRKLYLENFKTYELIRGHKLTITSDLTEDEINEIIDNKIKVYNSID
jgi:hypothetical protein